MLRKLYVHNFKTLLNFTFEPKGLNLLIGRNNAGKTNLCQALRFLARSAWGKLADAAVFSVGSVYSVTNRYVQDNRIEFSCESDVSFDGSEEYSFKYSLCLVMAPRQPFEKSLSVESESLRVNGGAFRDAELIRNVGGQTSVLNEPSYLSGVVGDEAYLAGSSPGDSTALATLFDTNTHGVSYLFKAHLMSWLFYDLENTRLRNIEARAGDQLLALEGGNLASVVHTLKTSNDRAYRELVELVGKLESGLAAINFAPSPDPNRAFMYFEHEDGQGFHPEQLSNGTLRMLALAYVFVSNYYAAQRGARPRLTVIEEAETGIFVGHLKDLFESIDPSGRGGQYIFTSHSPYFIDLFDAHLDGVFLLKREKTHTTLVRPDPERVRELIADEFSLGELHFREMLG